MTSSIGLHWSKFETQCCSLWSAPSFLFGARDFQIRSAGCCLSRSTVPQCKPQSLGEQQVGKLSITTVTRLTSKLPYIFRSYLRSNKFQKCPPVGPKLSNWDHNDSLKKRIESISRQKLILFEWESIKARDIFLELATSGRRRHLTAASTSSRGCEYKLQPLSHTKCGGGYSRQRKKQGINTLHQYTISGLVEL